MSNEWGRGDYVISTERARLDLNMIHDFLTNSSYWAKGRSLETVRRSIEHSLAFGLYERDRQVGFARVVTDRATFAWIADVYVLSSHRGHGLGRRLVAAIFEHPELQGLRRWMLATADAHGLYRQFGFDALHAPQRFMARESGAAARACAEG